MTGGRSLFGKPVGLAGKLINLIPSYFRDIFFVNARTTTMSMGMSPQNMALKVSKWDATTASAPG